MNIEYDYLEGYCPVEAGGKIDGEPFYFRARGENWVLSIGDDPIGYGEPDNNSWWYREQWANGAPYEAGHMSQEEAKACINKAVKIYLKSK